MCKSIYIFEFGLNLLNIYIDILEHLNFSKMLTFSTTKLVPKFVLGNLFDFFKNLVFYCVSFSKKCT
jgi:hypothetical protein